MMSEPESPTPSAEFPGERIAVVRAFADAITKRDLQAALDLCHPEIEFFSTMSQLEASPYRGSPAFADTSRRSTRAGRSGESRSSSCWRRRTAVS
jgi:hypothetical protein